MGKADLHGHTRHDRWGDGNAGIEELFEYVEHQTDLDLIAITDHDSTDAARAAWRLYERRAYRFGFLPGVEVTNRAGHLLCYFPDGNIMDIPSLRRFWPTVDFAHAGGALCVVAHAVYPPWLAAVVDRGLQAGRSVDGIEAINTGISEGAQSTLDGIAARFEGRVALLGNSDAHHLDAIGSAYTEFPGTTLADFLVAVRDRTTRPVFVRRSEMPSDARAFTTRRSMTRPGWVRNLYRELRPPAHS
jgi:predicted metal-dependent phosphoesterase TrpH